MLIAQVMQVVGDSIRCDFSIRRGNRQQLASDMFFSRAAFGGMDVSRARAYHRVMRTSQALESDDVGASTGEDEKHLIGAERVPELLDYGFCVRILTVGRRVSDIGCRDRRDDFRVNTRPIVRCERSPRLACGHSRTLRRHGTAGKKCGVSIRWTKTFACSAAWSALSRYLAAPPSTLRPQPTCRA